MSYQERRAIVNFISSILITALYSADYGFTLSRCRRVFRRSLSLLGLVHSHPDPGVHRRPHHHLHRVRHPEYHRHETKWNQTSPMSATS